jgi:hypothetical protein
VEGGSWGGRYIVRLECDARRRDGAWAAIRAAGVADAGSVETDIYDRRYGAASASKYTQEAGQACAPETQGTEQVK